MMSAFAVGTDPQSTSEPLIPYYDESHETCSVGSTCSSHPLQIDLDQQAEDIFGQDNQPTTLSSTAADQVVEPERSAPFDDSESDDQSPHDGTPPQYPDEETHIALGQLEELEVAILVQKNTRVDGRKSRWQEHRIKKEAVQASGSDTENSITTPTTHRKRTPKKRSSYKVEELKSFLKNQTLLTDDIKEDPDCSDTSSNQDYLLNSFENNNNQIDSNMKEESSAAVLGPKETNNVLETMKQQFLEGTCHLPDAANVPAKDKKPKKLSTGTLKNNENVKKRPGRPRKTNSLSTTPKPLETSSQNVKSVSPADSLESVVEKTSAKISKTPDVTPRKEGTSPTVQPSPTDFYSRKNPLTKGLREVRKSESGSESNGSSPVKEGVHLSPRSPTLSTMTHTCPQSPTTLPDTPKENGHSKCLLVAAAARALSFQVAKPSEDKKHLNGVSPSQLTNGTSEKEDGDPMPLESINANGNDVSRSTGSKRGRGKRKAVGRVSLVGAKKTTSTLIVDVHNTMSGEPQTVIPAKNPVINKKKKPTKIDEPTDDTQPTKSSSSANGSEPTVPESSDATKASTPSSPASRSASKLSQTPNQPANNTSTNQPFSQSSSTVQTPPMSAEAQSTNGLTPASNIKPQSVSDLPNNSPRNLAKPAVSKGLKRNVSGTSAESSKLNGPEKRQRTMLDFTSPKQKPSKSLDESQIASLLPMSPSVKSSCNSPTKSPVSVSPRKSMESSDAQKNKTKSKSLSAVIEKLNSPSSRASVSPPSDRNSSASLTQTTQCKQEPVDTKPDALQLAMAAKALQFQDVSVLDKPIKIELLDEDDRPLSNLISPPKTDSDIPQATTEDLPFETDNQIGAKKCGRREVENLFRDEGTLNLLTSLHSSTRRTTVSAQESAKALINAQAIKAETFKQRLFPDKKRKLSGPLMPMSSCSKLGPSEAKRPRLDAVVPQTKPVTLQTKAYQSKKKIGRPSNAYLKKKREVGAHRSLSPETTTTIEGKSVPPLKIKIPSTQDNTPKTASMQPQPKSMIKPATAAVSAPKVPKAPLESRVSLPGASQLTIKSIAKKPMPQLNLASRRSLPANPSAAPLTSLIKHVDGTNSGKQKRGHGEGIRQSQRASVRQSEASHFRDVVLRKFKNFVQIIINPSTTKIKNSLNARVLRELCEALSLLKRDSTVGLVLVSGVGSNFCQGLDLTSLQHSNVEIRKKNAHNLARALREFLMALVQYPKMIVAGVNGNATGLGVTMLPLFDMVIATEKAEFFLPYGPLGQVPEGGSTYTFPHFFGKLQATKLFMGHKLTAIEAQKIGLVSDTLWSTTFMQELLPKIAVLANQPAAGHEATKLLVNHHLYTKLELSLESECLSLVQHWVSPEFSQNCKKLYESHNFSFQKPVNMTT